MNSIKDFKGKARHWIMTWNNPDITLDEFKTLSERAGASTMQAQLEKGENGTVHIQAYLGYPNNVHFNSVKKKFSKCHIEKAIGALASYEYCGKEESRVEGPVRFGEIPKPSKNTKGDTAAYNKRILEGGLEDMVREGLVNVANYKKIADSVRAF